MLKYQLTAFWDLKDADGAAGAAGRRTRSAAASICTTTRSWRSAYASTDRPADDPFTQLRGDGHATTRNRLGECGGDGRHHRLRWRRWARQLGGDRCGAHHSARWGDADHTRDAHAHFLAHADAGGAIQYAHDHPSRAAAAGHQNRHGSRYGHADRDDDPSRYRRASDPHVEHSARTSRIEVRLIDVSPGVSITATQNDLHFDPARVAFAATADKRPALCPKPCDRRESTPNLAFCLPDASTLGTAQASARSSCHSPTSAPSPAVQCSIPATFRSLR